MASKQLSKRKVDSIPTKKKFGGIQEGAGRPKKEINPDQIYKLALIHCTAQEISSIVGCAKSVIYDRFSDVLQKGHEEGQMSLKRKMHEVAMAGDTKMLIWLSKQRLGYKDVQPLDATQISFNIQVNEIPR